ncbi:MAG TPA: aminotransferase class I/II-fold pyridoxal phosphate-dependent enzyme [Polyangiaceae bacterium]|nr:aminotransferase class I/II-fold pyridoxal phosphate-dependent enzyme [Polyangiaceae bacterium]
MADRRYRFSPSRMVDTADRYVSSAADRGVIMNRAGHYTGDRVEVDGRELRSFGSCSYLGLELRPELKRGAIEATERYGTQCPFSRAYLENALYQELEASLEAMTGRVALVAASTTLAHFAALPVLVRDGDAVVMDQFAHASLHAATALLRDTHLELLRHQRLDQLEDRVRALLSTHRRVIFVCDGVYSMRGDFAPFDELRALMERHPGLHLYIDDAHSTSWYGECGRGAALSALGDHPRVVVALSLNKAFSAAGGALFVPDAKLKQRIRRCGGPMLFSGPIQPPMLGAGVASARLHLEPAFARVQSDLKARIEHMATALDRTSVPRATADRTPIFMVPCESPNITFELVRRLRERGFYTCPSLFPAVPVNHPGVRFTATLHNDFGDIDDFVKALEASYHEANDAEASARAPGPESARHDPVSVDAS